MPSNFGYLGDPKERFKVGGLIVTAKAAAALLVGDGVFVSAADTVDKSITAGDRLKRLGIVVGGYAFGDRESTDSYDIGDAAAAANQNVLVCTFGIAWAKAGAEIAAVMTPLMFDATTAGRLITAVNPDDLGKIVGYNLTVAAADGDIIKVLVMPL